MSKLINFTIILIAVSFILVNTHPCFAQEEVKEAYLIGSGDILDITTWKEADFTREEILVRRDGMITFPLINDIQAKDRTPMQVKQDIEEKLKEYLESPIVTVAVRKSDSKRFYILGEVVNTGEYPVARDLYMYTAGEPTGTVSEYLDWIHQTEAQAIVRELGFVPIQE